MLFLRRSLPVLFALLLAAPACKKESKSDDTSESKDESEKDSKKKKKKGDDDEDDDKKSKKKKKGDDDEDGVKTASDDGEKPKKKKSAKKKVTEDESNPLPDSWIRVFDDKLGYEFKVPAGTPKMKLSMSNDKKTAYYTTQTPKPHQIDLALAIFKDPSLNKDQVEAKTKKLLQDFGDLDVKIGNAVDMGHDYSLADFTSRMQAGKKNKGVVLVALDKTDNYVFYVSCEAADYEENKATIDHIWKSFEMDSGGASGTDGSADPDEN